MKWDINSSLKFARSLAKEAKLIIKVEDKLSSTFIPYTKNGILHLPSPTPMNIEEYEPALHKCISHNFEEVKYTQGLSYEEDTQEAIAHHLLSDYLAEKTKLGEYLGRDEVLSKHRSVIMSSVNIDEVVQDKGLQELLHTLTRARNDWQSYVHDDEISSLEKNGFIKLLNECKSTEELKELIRLVSEVDKDKEGDSEDAGDEDGNSGNSKDIDKEQDNGERTEGSGDTGADQGTDRDSEGKRCDVVESKREGGDAQSKLIGDKDNLSKFRLIGKSTEATVKYNPGAYTPSKEYTEVEMGISKCKMGQLRNLTELVDRLNLSKKVRKNLLRLKQSSNTYGLKSGRLNPKTISRIYTSEGPARIFKKRNSSRLELDSAISILCDCSGSMTGSRYRYASASCIATSLILQDLRIAHEVIGFSVAAVGKIISNMYYQFKKYGENNLSKRELIKRFTSTNLKMGRNSDGEALTYCMGHLINRQEASKVLLVLSDGKPNGIGQGNSGEYLRSITRAIEASPVDLVVIGIETNIVKEFYSNYQVVHEPEDLEGAILKLMSSKIIR